MLDFSLAPRKNEMIDTLCRLLRIPSVKGEAQELMPYGKGVFDALMTTLEIADKLDFDAVNLYSRLGYVDYGSGDEMVAVLTHLDVVPAGEGWTVPPFEGTVQDGRIYGRGAIDNKGPAVAALYALSALQENGFVAKKRVRLLFGCDEESGWSDIAYYKENVGQIPDYGISPDAEFPIINCEKGMVQLAVTRPPQEIGPPAPKGAPELLNFESGERVNVVPAKATCLIRGQSGAVQKLVDLHNADKRFPAKLETEAGKEENTLRVTAFGRSAHGSRPQEGINAALWLVRFLRSMPLARNAPAELIQDLGKNLGTTIDGSLMGIARTDKSGSLTVNLGYVHANEKIVEAGLDIRYPVSETASFVVEHVTKSFSYCSIEKRHELPSHYVEEDGFLVTELSKAYEELTGEKAYCLTMGGATYARAFPNCVAFGPLFPGQKGTEHQPDEYIEIDSFIKLADLLAAAIRALCG